MAETPASWTTRPMSEGHALSALQIGRHGRDRYPTAKSNAEKALAEVAELVGAISEHQRLHFNDIEGELHPMSECPEIRREYADAGLALYALGAPSKLGLDLVDVMQELVDSDVRRFT